MSVENGQKAEPKDAFMTGWQVNYDVLLDGKRSLWQCLRQALERQPALSIHVQPWLSPSASLGTYDFETMLAIFQLNADYARRFETILRDALK